MKPVNLVGWAVLLVVVYILATRGQRFNAVIHSVTNAVGGTVTALQGGDPKPFQGFS